MRCTTLIMPGLMLVSVIALGTPAHSAGESVRCGAYFQSAAAGIAAIAPTGASDATEVAAVWAQPDLVGTDSPAVLRGLVVLEVAKFLRTERTLPLAIQLVERLDRQYRRRGHPRAQWEAFLRGDEIDFDRILALALERLPEMVADTQERLRSMAARFLRERFRMPSIADLARESNLRGDSSTKERIVRALFPDDGDLFDDVLSEDPATLATLTNSVIAAFNRAAFQTDVPRSQRVQASRPSLENILEALARPTANVPFRRDFLTGQYRTEHLEQLISKVFGDMGELERFARAHNPARFNGYRPAWATIERMNMLARLIEEKPVFLVTSVNAGIPSLEAQVKTMKAYALDRGEGIPIVIIPTAQILDELPQALLDDPDVFILTHTISNPALALSNIGVLPKNINPFAGLVRRRQFQPGQIKIIGHPQLAMTSVATGLNHVAGTFLWSTGSLSQGIYPAGLPVQLRTSEIAHNNHVNGFLVVERADAGSGVSGRGVANSFHVRSVEFADHTLDNGIGFTDLGRRYFVSHGDPTLTVHVESQQPLAMVDGDDHDAIADQSFAAEKRRILTEFPGIRMVVKHDVIDGRSFRHWDFAQTQTLATAYQSGALDIEREYLGVVVSTNGIQSIRPDIDIRMINSNHPRWMTRLLEGERIPQYLEVLNYRIIQELRMAGGLHGVRDPLEWFLEGGRNAWLAGLNPQMALQYASTPRILDPSRVRVLRPGEPLTVGPRHRQVQLENHGDKGRGGAKGSPESHSAGNLRSISADSHVPAILGGWYNVGTSTPLRQSYSMGGYSAWANASAFVYPDGTIQLLIFQPHVASVRQRIENGLLSVSEFFGRDGFVVRENDNDRMPGSSMGDQFGGWRRRWQALFSRFTR